MLKKVVVWGSLGFCWQTALGILLPLLFITGLGNDGYGRLSFFLILLNPTMWFDFTGNINTGLLARLPGLDFSQEQDKIQRLYSSTWFWWLLIWGLLFTIALLFPIPLLTPFQFLILSLIPFLVSSGFWIILSLYANQRYHVIYQFQIAVTFSWACGCLLFSIVIPMDNAIVISSLSTGSIVFFLALSKKLHLSGKLSVRLIFQELFFNLNNFKRYRQNFVASIKFQSLFVVQAALGLFVLQIDRLIIARHLNWEWVAYYFIPLGLILKFSAFLAVFNRPLLSQIANLNKKSIREVRYLFMLIITGTFWVAIFGIIPVSVYLYPVVSFWLDPQFAQHATIAINFVIWIFPLSCLLMLGHIFLIALKNERIANIVVIITAFAHCSGTYVGITLFGTKGIGTGFLAEACGALVAISILARKILCKKEQLYLSLFLGVAAIIWGALILISNWALRVAGPVTFFVAFAVQAIGVISICYFIWRNRSYENSIFTPFFR